MKAIALLSGGLDSLLVAKLLDMQGIEVIAVHCITPFALQDKIEIQQSLNRKLKVNNIKAELVIVELAEDFLEIVKNPKYGYGKNFNPCMDCKVLMLKKAKELMATYDAKFIVTGEVLGQRPKSQYEDSLNTIEKAASVSGLLLRPLTAKLLPTTIVEKNGWVKSEFLFDFSGRTRTHQMNLAKNIGIVEFPWPYGGCVLTESSFAKRIQDLLDHNSFTIAYVELLTIGRQFRINDNFKLVVGRNEKDNNRLLQQAKNNDLLVEAKDFPGPLGLGKGVIDNQVKELSSRIIAYYLRCPNLVAIDLKIFGQDKEEIINVLPLEESKITQLRL